jgi:HJR/Mrr/RecB family endonuclease
MSNPNSHSQRTRQVFLSYAQDDKLVARRLADGLRAAGLRVWFDEWALAVGDSIVPRIEQAIATSDLLLVLLSPRSVESRWVQMELSSFLARELKDRAITLILALIEDCEIPPVLADRQYLDLRKDFDKGLERLISQLRTVPDIDFSKLDGRTFEKLVGDLLLELGFSIQQTPLTSDSGFDFIASFSSRDPFGAVRQETWFVEVKLYRDQRVSVSALRQMLGYLMTSPREGKGLVVTNSRLTSVARDFLSEASAKSGYELRVVDGIELTNLLSQYPGLVERYFGRSTEQ